MAINGRALVEQLRNTVTEITVLQLHEILQKKPQTIVIDVRETQETTQGSILNAILIPRGVLEMQIDNNETISSISQPLMN